MSNEVVTIKVTDDDYFLKYIQLRTYNTLSKNQYKVLAELAKRRTIGTKERKEIREEMGISTQSLNNLLSNLKQLNLIYHDPIGQLYHSKIVIPDEPGSITFNFVKR